MFSQQTENENAPYAGTRSYYYYATATTATTTTTTTINVID